MKTNRLIIIGHRGARALAPENTIASLQVALDHNVDMVEIDVHTTLGGAIVLNHDPHYVNVDGKQVLIYDSTHDEMRTHRDDVITLQEAIDFIDRRVPMIIEVKPGVNADQVCQVVQTYLDRGWTFKDLRFCSYSPTVLKRIKKHYPKATLIMNEDWSSIRAVWRARQIGTKNIAMFNRWLWVPVIKGITRRGFTLYSFTVNNPETAQKWHKAGMTAVYTDRPDLYADILKP